MAGNEKNPAACRDIQQAAGASEAYGRGGEFESLLWEIMDKKANLHPSEPLFSGNAPCYFDF